MYANSSVYFDAIQPITVAQFQCAINSTVGGPTEQLKYFIGRIWTSNGKPDKIGIQNIQNFLIATNYFLVPQGYMFPCVSDGCPSASDQVKSAWNSVKASLNSSSFVLWIDVEGENIWPKNKTANQFFVQELVGKANSLGLRTNIFTSKTFWDLIVGNFKTLSTSTLLWYANYDGQPNMNDFQPFGGWRSGYMKQYAKNIAGPCGITMNKNWFQY
uniref:Uncharacterized protein n=1 Tax=Panagrolaimus sp. PS1159 TaxID=55785 RepID=A0AC35EZR5_9BILA